MGDRIGFLMGLLSKADWISPETRALAEAGARRRAKQYVIPERGGYTLLGHVVRSRDGGREEIGWAPTVRGLAELAAKEVGDGQG